MEFEDKGGSKVVYCVHFFKPQLSMKCFYYAKKVACDVNRHIMLDSTMAKDGNV